MVKKTDYFISGVWKNEKDVITHVMLHKVSNLQFFDEHIGTSLPEGKKTLVSEVIYLIKERKQNIRTTIWENLRWKDGASVSVYGNYLRTDRDETTKNNLDNLMRFTNKK